jgi:D-aminopeptidase
MGSTQVDELGEIESPIVLTSTLNVPRAADAVLDYLLALPGNEEVRSANPVVAETNDGLLNDIRGRHVGKKEVLAAITGARGGPVDEGCVGAGTGTVAFSFKGGIGTASRKLPAKLGGYTVGVLVQTNYGGVLTIDGAPVGQELGRWYLRDVLKPDTNKSNKKPGQDNGGGSIIIVIATDAPVDARNLRRMAARSMLGLGRTGAAATNGSGDYAIAFSTAPGLRVPHARKGDDPYRPRRVEILGNEATSPLFLAVIEATEEAIYNSLFRAVTTTSCGRTVEALPVEETVKVLKKYGRIKEE